MLDCEGRGEEYIVSKKLRSGAGSYTSAAARAKEELKEERGDYRHSRQPFTCTKEEIAQ